MNATGDDPPDLRFQALVESFAIHPNVSTGTGFGASPGMRVGGRIFAMLANNELIAKLPKPRVDELVASGIGARFDPGHGRPMKEWVTVPSRSDDTWDRLAAEAFAFVGRT